MKKKSRKSTKTSLVRARSKAPLQSDFDEVVRMIEAARASAVRAVNTRLIELYWSIGEHISRKIESAAWGEAVVDQLARHIAESHPGLRGYTRANLFRMRQFYETYRASEIVAPLVRQLSWTHNLLIMARSKRDEEREFYLRMAARERWSKRELQRQLNGALFERVALSPVKLSPPAREMCPDASAAFKDSYLVEFLDLPKDHSEADLHRALVEKLKNFLIELGRDFCYVGSHFPVQVGGKDFELDLLFFHRGLRCLVDIELKIEEFQPEHLGKLEFYLEALDRDVKKPHENPAIGLLLCATKNEEVVEYALSRSASPAIIAEYQTRLPDKKLLQAKLHEFYEQAQATAETLPPPSLRSSSPVRSPTKRKNEKKVNSRKK